MMDTLDADEKPSWIIRLRFLGPAALMGLSLAFPAASAAFADQCPQRESLIATDRPDITNSRLVVPQDSFQNEKGVIFTQRDGDYRITLTQQIDLHIGLASTTTHRPIFSASVTHSGSTACSDHLVSGRRRHKATRQPSGCCAYFPLVYKDQFRR
jgi:hypothetical protein